MRVLHILEATRGGTRRHVLDLLPALQSRGVDCTLIGSPLRNPDFPLDAAYLQHRGVATQEIEMARGLSPARDVAAMRELVALLKTQRYDLIHCHSTKAGALGRLARWLRAPRTPLVYTPHCLAFDTSLPTPQRRAARWSEALLAPLTTHFIAVSKHEERIIRATGLSRRSRVSTIYNGIDLDDFDHLPELSRAEFGLGEGDFVIGCFGRLTRQKNQGALVAVLPQVLAQVPRARLMLVGGGEDEGALHQMAHRLGVWERVLWIGEVNEARPFYKLCDVIAQPSRWEGCPYSILEAMAARRCVIAHGVGGVEEILNDSYGVSYPTSHVSHRHMLPDWLCKAARDDRWRNLTGEAARGRVEREFQLQHMVQSTLDVYERVVHVTAYAAPLA